LKYQPKFKLAKILRIFSQIVFFLLFIYIYFRSLDPFSTIFNPFLRYDPLIFLTHFNLKFLIPILVIIFLTFIFGRFFCGWVCPLGFLIDIIDIAIKPFRTFLTKNSRAKSSTRSVASKNRNIFKRFLISQSFSKSKKFFKKLNLYPPAWLLLGAVIVTIFTILPLLQFLHPNIWIVRIFSLKIAGLTFFGILAFLSLIKSRFWCRYICPLGALYGLLARLSLFKLKITHCRACGICDSCPMGAIDYEKGLVQTHQCTLCFNHEYKCSLSGFEYKPVVSFDQSYDSSRREFLKQSLLLASGLAIGGLLSITKASQAETELLRPPGVIDEVDFVERCLRCFQCVKSCPNDIIKITTIESGISSFLTPHLEFGEYGCDYNCQVCQLVCPNYAIPLQKLNEKQHTKIGIAKIDRELCVVYAKDIDCIVCEEFCPTVPKAILLDVKETTLKNGKIIKLKYPKVDKNLCIGCGICEANCPAELKAIRVYKNL